MKMRLSSLLTLFLKDLASLTYQDAVKRRLVTPFIVFVFFLISFAAARILAYSLPSLNLIIGRYHIHHFYYGIALLIASGWIALISDRERLKHLAAALFGVGLGILADEAGLLLTCTSPMLLECDYYARVTIDVFTVIAAAFLTVLYFMPLWRRFKGIFSRARFFLFFLE